MTSYPEEIVLRIFEKTGVEVRPLKVVVVFFFGPDEIRSV